MVLLGLSCAAMARAGDAFFSKDGQSVTFVSGEHDESVLNLNLTTRNIETVSLGTAIKGQSITSLASGEDGELLFLTEKGAWVNDANGTRKLCGLGSAAHGADLSVAPATAAGVADWLFIAGDRAEKDRSAASTLHYRKPGEKEFRPVFCRRVNSVWAGAFTSDGRFFFAGESDLWEGAVDPDPVGGGVATLNGVRIAPLALKNTDCTNGGNLWVAQVMPAGSSIYVRLRGTHMGILLRVPVNPVPALDDKSGASGSLIGHYAYLAKALSAVQIIEPEGKGITASAAAETNGRELLFYRSGLGGVRYGLFIWDKASGKSEQVAMEP